MLQGMAYATSEEKYLKLYKTFTMTVLQPILDYFNKYWHPVRDQWVTGMNYSTETNNRLKSLYAKLKSVNARYSSLEEFVDNF